MSVKCLSTISLVGLAFLGGALFGKMIHLHIFSFQREINPVHAISVLGTIFVAVFVAVLVDRNKSKDKCEKELFLKRVDSVISVAEALHDKINNQEIPLVEATSKLKRIRSSVKCVYQALVTVSKTIGTEEKHIANILTDLNTVMTLTPPKPRSGTSDMPIRIAKGVISYSESRVAEIESQIELLKNALFTVQVEINKCYPLG